MPASTILLVETDLAAGEVITNLLSGVGYSLTTIADPDEAFRRAGEHHLVIIDVLAGSKGSFELCREIRATPALAAIPVLCVSQSDDVEERIRFLEAGADDVMARPFDERELEARVEALLLRFLRSRDRAPLPSPEGSAPSPNRMIACYSPKGGVGTTTIAVNVAMIAAARRPEQALLVDLDLQWGQVATHLNLKPRLTIADLARDEAAQREPEFLRTYATRYDAGLWVLAAPPRPDMAESILPAHVEQILKTSLDAFDLVVVDAGSILDERTLTAFDCADTVVLTVHPEIAALKAVASLLEYLAETGSVSAKMSFVLNQIFSRELVKPSQVESSLGVKVIAELPYDSFVYVKAVNEGVPVVQGAPRTLAAERLTKLAGSLFGELPVAAPGAREERRGLLGGLLRRA